MAEQRPIPEQAPEQTVSVQVDVRQGHPVRNTLIAGSIAGSLAAAAFLAYEGWNAIGGHADSSARISAGVNHDTEVWKDFKKQCDKKVSEFVSVTGIQHNVLVGGLTSGGLKVDKALAGDFLVCGSDGMISGKRKDIMKDGKLVRSVLHFTNNGFSIESPRVDHLDPANRAPLRADDSAKDIAKKLADCAKKEGKDVCDDTGVEIMWPRLYEEKVCVKFVGCKEVSIPGPKIAVNPDETLMLATLMYAAAQLAIATDGTTVDKWHNELKSFQEEIRADREQASGVSVTIETESLPSENEVIQQRLEQLAPDLKGQFKEAVFSKGKNDSVRLHLVGWRGAKLDILLSEVNATDTTLQTLNGYLEQYQIASGKGE